MQADSEEFLSRPFHANQEVNRQKELLEKLRERTQRATVSYDSVQVSHSPNMSSLQDAILEMVQQEEKVDMAIDRLAELKKETAAVIDRVDNPNYHMVLELRYLGFKSWNEISSDLHHSRGCIRSFHERALKIVDRLLNEKEGKCA